MDAISREAIDEVLERALERIRRASVALRPIPPPRTSWVWRSA